MFDKLWQQILEVVVFILLLTPIASLQFITYHWLGNWGLIFNLLTIPYVYFFVEMEVKIADKMSDRRQLQRLEEWNHHE